MLPGGIWQRNPGIQTGGRPDANDGLAEEQTMAKSVLHIIEDRMSTFSKGQKRIGRYILDHYDQAAFMTASKLGRLTEVSESTVVRFAAELGYDGYPSMQKALQEMARSRLTSTQRIRAGFRRRRVFTGRMCSAASCRRTLKICGRWP